jgi:hypothetical protein
MEYKDRPLVPLISYSAATLIGLSRITENAHWITMYSPVLLLDTLRGARWLTIITVMQN